MSEFEDALKGKTRIRPSGLTGWPDCARRGSTAVIPREIKAAGFELRDAQNAVAASVGTATHAGAALLLEEKMRGRVGPGALDAAEQAGVDAFRKECERGVVYDSTSPTPSTAERQVVRMTQTYARFAVPEIEPLAVEERLVVDIGDGFILSGQSDAVARAPGVVEDTKTGVVSRAHTAQLGAYTLIQRSHGRDIRGARTRFIQRVPLTKDQPRPVVTPYDLEDIEPLARHRIERVKREITEFRRRVAVGDKPPEFAFDVNSMSMLCSEKFCRAFGTNYCAEWRYKEKKDS